MMIARLTKPTILRFQLPLVLALSPVLLFPTPQRLAFVAPLAALWLVMLFTTRTFPRTPLNTALVVLLAAVALSLLVTFDVRISLGKVSGVALGALLYWSLSHWLDTPARLKVGIACFAICGAGLAIVGILGINGVGKVEELGRIAGHYLFRIRGLPGAEQGFNPNPIAGTLVLFIPVQTALLMTRAGGWLSEGLATVTQRRAAVAAQVLLLVITAGTFLLMQSRGAALGLGAAFVCYMAARTHWVRWLLAATTVAVLVTGSAIGWRTLLEEAIVRSGPGEADTRLFVAEHDFAVRMQIWSVSIRGIEDYAWTGMGMNAFRYVMPARYPVPVEPAPVYPPHAHNNVLQTALDIGIPGLVAYLAIWIIAGAMLVRVRSAATAYHPLAPAFGIGLGAYFLFGVTDAIPLGAKVGIMFWATLALVTAVHRHAIAAGRAVTPAPGS